MLGTKLGPYWLTCWGFLCPVLLPLLLTYVLVTQVIIGNVTIINIIIIAFKENLWKICDYENEAMFCNAKM